MLKDNMAPDLGLVGHEAKAFHQSSRLPAGVNLCLSVILAGLAVALRSPWLLAGLAGVNLIYLVLNRSPWRLLWKACRFFVWQSAVLLLLHYLKFGSQGVLPGLRVSSQLFLAFLPGMIFLQGTRRSQIVRVANRFLSARAAFVLGSSLHFLPLMTAEIRDIYQAQLLRGARLQPFDICKPWCWPDWIGCLIVPCTVQTLALAGEIAQAAKIRDFGVCHQRTCWPENRHTSLNQAEA